MQVNQHFLKITSSKTYVANELFATGPFPVELKIDETNEHLILDTVDSSKNLTNTH